MERWMDKVFARYGVAAQIQSDRGNSSLKVFFHSVKSTAWQNLERAFCPLGEVPRGMYVCLLPASAEVAVADTLLVGSKSYQIQRLEDVTFAGKRVYLWSLCVEKGSEDGWALSE